MSKRPVWLLRGGDRGGHKRGLMSHGTQRPCATDGWASFVQNHPEKQAASGESQNDSEPNQLARPEPQGLHSLHELGALLGK